MPSQIAVEARELSKRFLLRHNRAASLKVRFLGLLYRQQREILEEFWALKRISLRIGAGEAVGLIGRNGSGKSTFLKLVAGIHRPTTGRLLVAKAARIGTMIELGVGFHPDLNGTENVFLNAAIHGLSRPQIEALYDRIVEYSGLRHFMDVPLKNYSSGMHMRLGFAIAANLDPDILLLDEIFAVGDEDFQKQCMRTMEQLAAKNRTIVFVSHASAAIRAICQRVCLLDRGELLFDGGVDAGLNEYQRLMLADAAPAPAEALAEASREPVASDSAEAGEAALELEWHRAAMGGNWTELGAWQFEFMRQQGLEPDDFLLDVGCGSLAGAVRFLPYLDDRHYWGYELNRDLLEAGLSVELPRAHLHAEQAQFIVNPTFDLSGVSQRFDFAIAPSLFTRLSLNEIARCIVSVLSRLKPDGRFYATWFDNPDPTRFDPIVRETGLTTYPDAEPYHYPLRLVANVCESIGARAQRLDTTHPRAESVLVITRA